MQTTRTMELWVGVFVALGLGAVFLLALEVSGLAEFRERPSYEVTAHFDNVGGLREKAPVNMAGVRVGQVKSIELDPQSYQARVVMAMDHRFDRIPSDSTAAIYTSGLLGEQYVSLDPGWEEEYLSAGDRITSTQSAVVLERILGQFLYNLGDDD
ncbi:phospholipid/cholesterol/gamma-HCH transport system substrate-binding protein [Alkalispirillum mobile]|uniref:Phospholipid/cholesterol/gamma-HCH transport system substrate-binding protein n=1 Tax=Alkalispirillum mobile TaxID=85925 RepID=A0A498BX30_9GAMM|nr:outer membrane lipid asymmetry maintenance protein MlaD [Alkalispirillum mobile]RLK46886.1 phospholipid/cholesterol/gamma-HCH transport system substrate-binding protein [Alkalispirillum mobile]